KRPRALWNPGWRAPPVNRASHAVVSARLHPATLGALASRIAKPKRSDRWWPSDPPLVLPPARARRHPAASASSDSGKIAPAHVFLGIFPSWSLGAIPRHSTATSWPRRGERRSARNQTPRNHGDLSAGKANGRACETRGRRGG